MDTAWAGAVPLGVTVTATHLSDPLSQGGSGQRALKHKAQLMIRPVAARGCCSRLVSSVAVQPL